MDIKIKIEWKMVSGIQKTYNDVESNLQWKTSLGQFTEYTSKLTKFLSSHFKFCKENKMMVKCLQRES